MPLTETKLRIYQRTINRVPPWVHMITQHFIFGWQISGSSIMSLRKEYELADQFESTQWQITITFKKTSRYMLIVDTYTKKSRSFSIYPRVSFINHFRLFWFWLWSTNITDKQETNP